MLRPFLPLAVAGALFAAAPALAAPPVSLAGSEWCPYNCALEAPVGLGYMVDLAKEIFEPQGHKIDYTLLNWARALEEAKSGRFDGVVGSSKRDGFVFTKEPLGIARNGFAIRAGESFEYKGADSLKGKVLGAINGYSYTDEIDGYIAANVANDQIVQTVSGDNALTINLRKLTAKRVDLVVEDVNVLKQQLAALGMAKEVTVVVGGPPDPVFIAFAAGNPNAQKYADALDDGLGRLRASGRLKEILARYGLTDWK